MSADNSGTNSESWEEERAELLSQLEDSITAASESGNMLARIKTVVWSAEDSETIVHQIRSLLDEPGTEISPSDDNS